MVVTALVPCIHMWSCKLISSWTFKGQDLNYLSYSIRGNDVKYVCLFDSREDDGVDHCLHITKDKLETLPRGKYGL